MPKFGNEQSFPGFNEDDMPEDEDDEPMGHVEDKGN
jgi:hypothetical protein